MPPLPPEIYLPIAGVLVSAVSGTVGIAGKMLHTMWKRNVDLTDKILLTAPEIAAALSKGADAQNQHARRMTELATLFRGVTRAIDKLDSITYAQRQE